jgi:PAS domain S-box-containing protein
MPSCPPPPGAGVPEHLAARRAAMYAALSRTHRLIVRAHDERTLFAELCRIAAETVGVKVAVVLLCDANGATIAAYAGPASALFAGVTLRPGDDPAVLQSPSRQAIVEGRTVVCNDVANAPRTQPWSARMGPQGIAAVAALPLRRSGAVIGSFSLYADRAGTFDAELVTLLEDMAADISGALDALDREARRERAEREVEAACERMQQLFNVLPVAVTVVAEDDRTVIEVNAECCLRYGVAREALVGRRMSDLGIGVQRAEERQAFYDLLAHGTVHDVAVRVHDSRGRELSLLVSATRLDYMGRRAVLFASLDITEHNRLAAERLARAAAEAANRAKTEFVAHMSHELRTPLNAVLGFTQLMLAETPAADARRVKLEAIREAGLHLLALSGDLLDVSRIEAGALHIESRGLALAPLCGEVLQLMGPHADGRRVALEPLPASAAALWVRGDPLRMRQALLNLVSNAVKYNRPGGRVRLEVEASAEAVELRVADTGTGMTPGQLARLFEPYNRLGREQGGIEGTGLGMALTRRLVEAMGGRLAVESSVDHGTTVRWTLPRADPDDGAARAASAAAVEPAGVVLYIEDNPVNVMLVEELLRRWPAVRFETVEDGAQGIELARRLLPDLLLLDMQLPDMDGVAVLEALRARPATAALRVVMLSGDARPEDAARARAAGAIDYWAKPLDMVRFVDGMRRLLGPAGPTRA